MRVTLWHFILFLDVFASSFSMGGTKQRATTPTSLKAFSGTLSYLDSLSVRPSVFPVETHNGGAEEEQRQVEAKLALEAQAEAEAQEAQAEAEAKAAQAASQAAAEAASKVRQEKSIRALLEARLALESKRKEVEKAEAQRQSARRAEATARSLLIARLELEAKQRAKQAKLEKARAAEARQRAIFVARIELEEKARAAKRARHEKTQERMKAVLEARQQPKPPETEEEIKARLAAIEDVGERAFQILLNLGMVDVNQDPSSSDYDCTVDDEYCM